MSRVPLPLNANLALAVAICVLIPNARAEVFKCTDGGKTTYSDTPCDSRSKPIKLTDPTKSSGTDPHMCEQLLDELSRLATEARRNAARGHPESTSGAKRRNSLTRQYEQRCVGISRSK